MCRIYLGSTHTTLFKLQNKKESQKMTKPSDIKVENKKKPSAPVRNPAFREHEGLRALQKELNSKRAPRKNK
jgi:hypothetical protein